MIDQLKINYFNLAYIMHEFSDVKTSLSHRIHPYLKHIVIDWDEKDKHIYHLMIHLYMDENYGSTFSLRKDKDMRSIIPNINTFLNNHHLIVSYTYIEKPEPVYYTTQYLGTVVNWNMGYDTDKIKIQLEVS